MNSYLRLRSRRGALLALAGTLLSASLSVTQAAEPPVNVVASFSILGDIVREVGGADVSVSTLVGADGDAHEYEPTPGDAKTLAAAKVLFVNGLDFETWLPRLVKASGFAGKTVVASQGVTPRKFERHDADKHDHATGESHSHGDADPHAWQDLANGVIYARNVAEGLAQADPARADAYRQRADAYVAKIKALDTRVRVAIAAIPQERRKVVSSHDAFGYFGAAYGIGFISAVGLSTDAEPSAGDMARIIQQVKREKVPAVFVENISSPKLVEQIARETGAKVGGSLYSDALSAPGKPGATYLGMFEWNVKQLVDALTP